MTSTTVFDERLALSNEEIEEVFRTFISKYDLLVINGRSWRNSDDKNITKFIENGFYKCVLVNTAASYQKGEHWLMYIAHNPEDIEFFDSYGRAPSQFKGTIRSLPIARYNPYQYQAYESHVCGHYCCVYLWLKSHGYNLSDVGIKTTSKKDDSTTTKNRRITNDVTVKKVL